jgi:large subunit ribosomal protein MRP49
MEITLSFEGNLEFPLIAEHQPVEFACPAPSGARLALDLDGQPLDPFLRPGEKIWRWRWNPGPAVGVHRATLSQTRPDGSVTRRELALRVATRKIDQERYAALIEDIQRTAYGVLYTLAGTSAEGAGLQRAAPWRSNPLEEYYALFEERLDTFERAVRRIAARPHEHLRGEQARTPRGQAATIGADALARLPRGDFDEAPAGVADELQAALRPGGGLLPRDIPAAHATPTADIYEHRLLKHLLGLLLRRARYIGALAEREAARLASSETGGAASSARHIRVEQIAAGCADASRRLRDLRGLPFLADVRPLPAFRGPTPLLQRDATYREIYRMWLAQRQPPFVAFDSPLFHLPIADLPRLYEAWCALEVVRGLLALGGVVREQRLIEQPRADEAEPALEFALGLIEQTPLLVIDHDACALTLRYQPHYRPLRNDKRRTMNDEERRHISGSSFIAHRSSFSFGSLDRHNRVPDLAIEVQRPGAPPQVLLLDAKYRLDADGRGVPQDALADAYTYFGAIGHAGARATIGALLLYPGAGAPELYPSGVGALPLLPGRAGELEVVLADQRGVRR